MSLKVKSLENELMKSNCYIVTEEASKSCIIIDPASEKSEREIEYIDNNGLHLDYILLTHEHSDHTWGANTLKEKFPDAKIVCSELCEKYAKKSSKAYFLLYYNKKGYRYELMPADIIIHSDEDVINWRNIVIHFVMTPGHSYGSVCIDIDGMLFTGDTIMPFEAYFNGRDSNEEDWIESIHKLKQKYRTNTVVMPGHGCSLIFFDWLTKYFVKYELI